MERHIIGRSQIILDGGEKGEKNINSNDIDREMGNGVNIIKMEDNVHEHLEDENMIGDEYNTI